MPRFSLYLVLADNTLLESDLLMLGKCVLLFAAETVSLSSESSTDMLTEWRFLEFTGDSPFSLITLYLGATWSYSMLR